MLTIDIDFTSMNSPQVILQTSSPARSACNYCLLSSQCQGTGQGLNLKACATPVCMQTCSISVNTFDIQEKSRGLNLQEQVPVSASSNHSLDELTDDCIDGIDG